MARVTATKLRQVIVVVGGDLPDGFTPENIAFYNPDGTPFDFSSIVAAGLSWGSAWTVEGMYEPLTMVKHDNALWIAVANTLIEAGVEPGVPLPSTTDAPGGVEPAGTYTRLAGGVTADVAWPEPDGLLYFFDLSPGGSISIDTSIDNGWAERLYDSAGALLVTSAAGGPLEAADLPAGRYFAWLPYPAGAATNTDITLTLSDGAQEAVEPWELVVQGVAP